MSVQYCYTDCKYLSITQREQNKSGKRNPHLCNLYKKQVKHLHHHPRLIRLRECNYNRKIVLATEDIKTTIEQYYEYRGLKWPTPQEAILWAVTELGEATDLLLMQNTAWIRNHPGEKEEFTVARFSEEIGDVIMMLLVAIYVTGAPDPIETLQKKLRSKTEAIANDTP